MHVIGAAQASAADFALHPLESVDLPAHPLPPSDAPPLAYHFTDGHIHASWQQPVADADARAARRAYRAATTGMDRKVGRLLDELDALGLENSTAVVAHSDHGWHLGEHNMWRKMTNFEAALRVPLIIRAPWLPRRAPRSAAIVELVDVLPTIAALAGLTLPVNESFDGVSRVPLLLGEGGDDDAAAFSQYPRRVKDAANPWKENSIIHHNRSEFTHMGFSVRTAEWRLTMWVVWDGTRLAPIWSNVSATELYDHRGAPPYPTDFDASENENVAANASHAAVVAELGARLRAMFP